MSVLAARGLTVEARRRGGTVPVLRGINFAVEPGQVLGLVGEAGAGAAVVGRAVAQRLPPGLALVHGSLSFLDAELAGMPAEERRGLLGRDIAFLPPSARSALHPGRTVGAQLEAHLRHLGVARRELRGQAMAALAGVGVAEAVLGRLPHRLSQEECQLVLVALAFAGAPKLVVAEDPTSALDAAAQGRVLAAVQGLRRAQGAAMLFITRDLLLAGAICDELAVMMGGDIVEIGPAASVLRAPRHPYTRSLLLATPPMRGPRPDLYLLPEPASGERALVGVAGCRFAPRCPVRAEYCLRTEPPLEGDGHRSACIRPGLVPTIMAQGEVPPPPWRPVGEVPVLALEGVAKAVTAGPAWRRETVAAVHDVSLRIAPGEFVAVVGEEGCGASLLARLAAGLERPAAGRTVLAGVDVTAEDESARRQRAATVQMVFDEAQAALTPWRRVSDIVTEALTVRHARFRVRETRARQLLAEMGMALELGVRLPGQLGEAQRRRVALARALCGEPKLLVADGLFDGLDAPAQADLLGLLLRLRHRIDFALLLVCRDLAVARHLCERVLVMHQGAIVEDGLADTVFGWPRHDATKALLAGSPR
jgi:peptide/nickel transport system ATP-binding protein